MSGDSAQYHADRAKEIADFLKLPEEEKEKIRKRNKKFFKSYNPDRKD